MSDGTAWWRRLLDGWLLIAGHFGEVQTLVILGLVYVLVIGPAALVSRALGGDFLSKRKLAKTESAWQDADSRPPSLENLEQPF